MSGVDESSIPLSEDDVGISEFLGSHHGFFGIIKQRYSDFLVNEIGASGEELHLTDIANLPNPPTPVVDASESTPEISPEVGLPDGVTEEIHQKLKDLTSHSESTKSTVETKVLVVVDTLNKEQRRAIHQFVQLECEGLVSTTDEINGQKVIRVAAGSAASLQRERKRRVPRQPKLFTHFLLYKENMDTMEAVSKLASKLRLRAQDVGYAGTKDRRGKTVQLASISKIPPSRIADAARCVPRLRVGNFSFSPDGLALGQLGGNAFTIVLREVKGSDEEIATAVSSVQRSGILNYYGLQRFGTQPGHTHIVGKYLLQANWAKAIETILIPRPGDFEGQERSETLQAWREGRMTSEEAMNKLQYSGCLRGGVERHLIQGMLQRGDSDKLGAINCIPRNWRTLYLHAYQAWLWNKLVSRRIKEHGTAVLPGDLVKIGTAESADSEMTVEEDQSLDEDMDATDSPEKEEASDTGDNNSASSPTETQGIGCSRKGSAKLEKLHSCVRPITAEDVHSIQLHQVMIPSVGYAVRLPSNHMADWYREMLKEDDLTMEHLDPKHKSFAVSGAYRPLLLKPKNLSYKIAYYTDPLKSLVISDLDKLNGIHESTLELDTTAPSQNGNPTDLTSNEVGHPNLQVNFAHGKDGDESNAENYQSNGSTSVVSEKNLVTETGELMKVSSILIDDKEHLPVAEEEIKPSSEDKDCVTQPDYSSLSDPVDDKASDEPVNETAINKNGSACSDGTNDKMIDVADEVLCDSTEDSSSTAPLADGEQRSAESSTTVPSAPKRLKAVVLQFSLPPAGYATMVLRELLKIDTGSQYHASLNSSQAFGDSKGDRGRGGYRGAGRGDRGRDGRGRSNWTSNRGGGSYRGGDRSHRGGWGRGFHGSRGDSNKRSSPGQKSERGNNKRPRY